jgi:hypothetical protein
MSGKNFCRVRTEQKLKLVLALLEAYLRKADISLHAREEFLEYLLRLEDSVLA